MHVWRATLLIVFCRPAMWLYWLTCLFYIIACPRRVFAKGLAIARGEISVVLSRKDQSVPPHRLWNGFV